MLRALVAVVWTLCWPVVAFLAIGFAMMGDPVEGAEEQRRLFGGALLMAAIALFILGHRLIFRKRAR